MVNDLLYYIPAGQYGKEGVLALLEQHPEIKFVSLVGVDLAGNDTDEKITRGDFCLVTCFGLCSIAKSLGKINSNQVSENGS